MLFRDLKQGSAIYLFDKSNAQYTNAKVISTTLPHLDTNFKTSNQLVIDITIEANGEQRTYTMQEGTEIAFVGTTTISATKEGVLREIETLKSQSEQTLNQQDFLKDIVSKCNTLLVELNPIEKQKAELESWKQTMETSISEIKTMLSELTKK